MPSVYYGDEFGLEAVKENRPDGDDAVRPEMPGDRWLFDAPHPEVEQVYRRVIGLRRRHPWLVDAVITTEQVDTAHLVVRSRARHGDESLTLALNLTDEPFRAARRRAGARGRARVDRRAVAPHGWAIFAG